MSRRWSGWSDAAAFPRPIRASRRKKATHGLPSAVNILRKGLARRTLGIRMIRLLEGRSMSASPLFSVPSDGRSRARLGSCFSGVVAALVGFVLALVGIGRCWVRFFGGSDRRSCWVPFSVIGRAGSVELGSGRRVGFVFPGGQDCHGVDHGFVFPDRGVGIRDATPSRGRPHVGKPMPASMQWVATRSSPASESAGAGPNAGRVADASSIVPRGIDLQPAYVDPIGGVTIGPDFRSRG